MSRALLAVLVLAAGLVVACSGGGGDSSRGGEPLVSSIPLAVAAVEGFYGGPQEYFEISAQLDSVSFVVAVDDATAAEQGSWSADGGLVGPEPVGEASGSTFTADRIDVDPDLVFDELRAELGDPAIIDFAIQGGPSDTVLYDATIASDGGGVILVLLGPDGTIRGVQGR